MVKVKLSRSSRVRLLVDKFKLTGRRGGLTAEFYKIQDIKFLM